VKLFWHRPLEGQGSLGQKALAASAPLVKNIGSEESNVPSQPSPSKPATAKPDPATVAALAARQQLLEKLISEQKVLMSRLSTATTPEEKKELMERIKKIQSGMASSSAPPAASQPIEAPTPVKKEEKDVEMAGVEAGSGSADAGSSTEALKARLAQLKAEVSSYFE